MENLTLSIGYILCYDEHICGFPEDSPLFMLNESDAEEMCLAYAEEDIYENAMTALHIDGWRMPADMIQNLVDAYSLNESLWDIKQIAVMK